MVAGNVGFDQQIHNAFLTLNVAGPLGSVPVHLDCRRPLVRPWVSTENVHGDGVGGTTIDMTGCDPDPEHAVDALIHLAAESPGELTIVCIGPLTNLATATAKDPTFVDNVKALYVMGGRNNARGNTTAAAEFNVYVDPEAAKAAFAAGFNITVIPWAPLTLERAAFGPDQLAEIEALDTPLSDFFTRACATTLEFDRSAASTGPPTPTP